MQKKIRKIDNKIKKLKSEIRNLDKDDTSNKNKLKLKIENYKLEIIEILSFSNFLPSYKISP